MRPALWLAALLFAAGCGSSSNRLYGSISSVYGLDFDTVAISQIQTYLVVEYLRGAGGKTVKLSVDQSGLQISAGKPIDLTEMVGGSPRGLIQRIVETTVNLPMSLGTITLDQTPAAGAPLSGHFVTTLSDPMGRTLNGDFDGMLVQK